MKRREDIPGRGNIAIGVLGQVSYWEVEEQEVFLAGHIFSLKRTKETLERLIQGVMLSPSLPWPLSPSLPLKCTHTSFFQVWPS